MTLTFDTTNLSQYQINMIQAVLVELLYTQGITYDDLNCSDGICEVENPSADIAITIEQVTAQLAVDDAAREAAAEAAAAADALTLQQLQEQVAQATSIEEVQAIVNNV
jgi:hypothetical protein